MPDRCIATDFMMLVNPDGDQLTMAQGSISIAAAGDLVYQWS